MQLRTHLVIVSDIYAKAVGLSRSRVSTLVLNRGATLDALAAGTSDVTTGTFEKAMRWYSAHWPEGADWPHDIARPVAEPAE